VLFGRAITLRNCGRFTVVASDFGSDYRTQAHVSSEALYASLTREVTRRPGFIDLNNDPYEFEADYGFRDGVALPIWFLPGVFVDEGSYRLPDAHFDTTFFNVVSEVYPSTSQTYVLRTGDLRERKRPYHVPTYGSIQAVLPDRCLLIYAFSPDCALLEAFEPRQTYLLGKKRTMFQIAAVSATVEGATREEGSCETPYLEVTYQDTAAFSRFHVLAATMRYLIIRGETRGVGGYVEFPIPVLGLGDKLCLPDFYLRRAPFPVTA